MAASHDEAPAAGLTLYHTLGCHLCELAQSLVTPLAQAAGVRLEHVDIADDERLLESYGTRIPVLCARGAQDEELGWPFDARAVGELLARFSQARDGGRNQAFR